MLYWREISPLAVPILLENACVLLMGVLSTFLVSWLGKEAMAGVGLADSFLTWSSCPSLPLSIWAPRWWWPLKPRQARSAAGEGGRAPVAGHHDHFFHFSGGVIHYFGQEIIDFVAGDATNQVKDLALTYLELTALSYPAAAIALIGSGELRGAGTTKSAADQRRDEYPEYHHQQRVDLRRIFLGWVGVRRCRSGADHFSLYWRDSDYLGADGGHHAGAAAVAEGLLQTL